MPEQEAEQSIREGVTFKGTNIIILVFAILIASLGLNTNSTAVIIGAMLISPLMGPIIGLGLGIGVEDFELVKRSMRNLTVAAAFRCLPRVFISCFRQSARVIVSFWPALRLRSMMCLSAFSEVVRGFLR